MRSGWKGKGQSISHKNMHRLQRAGGAEKGQEGAVMQGWGVRQGEVAEERASSLPSTPRAALRDQNSATSSS